MYASMHRRTFLRREHGHGLFEEPRTSVSGHRGRTGAALDLGATLAGSFDSKLSKMRAFSDRPLTALGLSRSGRQPIAIFRKRFFFLEKNDYNSDLTLGFRLFFIQLQINNNSDLYLPNRKGKHRFPSD